MDRAAAHRANVVFDPPGDGPEHGVVHHGPQQGDRLARGRAILGRKPRRLHEAGRVQAEPRWPSRSSPPPGPERRGPPRGPARTRRGCPSRAGPRASRSRLREGHALDQARTGAAARDLGVHLRHRGQPVEGQAALDHGERRGQLRDRGDGPGLVGPAANSSSPSSRSTTSAPCACTLGRFPRSQGMAGRGRRLRRARRTIRATSGTCSPVAPPRRREPGSSARASPASGTRASVSASDEDPETGPSHLARLTTADGDAQI